MELNFDRYTGWFNANIAWGDVSLSMTYNPNYASGLPYMDHQNVNNEGGPSYTGPSENGYYEHIPISFYNAWTVDFNSMGECFGEANHFNRFVFHNANISCWRLDNFDLLEIRMPHDSFHTHGQRWNSESYTFPRDIAHPYLMGSRNLKANSIGIARPQVVAFNRKYKKDEHWMNYHVMDPGPISLAHFYDGCERINFPINLYQFTPEWNGQFWFESGGVQITQNLSPISWHFASNDHYDQVYCPATDLFYAYKLPMIIDEYYVNNMPVPWLRDVSYMFANNGLWNYKHRIEIPCFIDNAAGMFCKVNYLSVSNNQNFNFDFNYNTIDYKGADGESHPLMLDLSYMFCNSGWTGASIAVADAFVYNDNMTGRNVILPKRTINTVSMFAYTVWNFNIHFDSNIVSNTSRMFEYAIGFNGDINWYHAMPTNRLISGPGKINDASNMFYRTNMLNREIWFPANGVNNASNMFMYSSIGIDSEITNFRIKLAKDSDIINSVISEELPNYIYAYRYDYTTNIFTQVKSTYNEMNEDSSFSISLPSGILDATSMFQGSHINKTLGGIFINSESCYNAYAMFDHALGITNSIYVGDNCGSINCSSMFTSPGININRGDDGFIFFGKNSMHHDDVFRPPFNIATININVKYMTFDINSGKHARGFFSSGNFNIDRMVIYDAFKDVSTNASWSAGELFAGYSSNIFINSLTIYNSFYAYDPSYSNDYGAQFTFANHSHLGEDIKRLDIVGDYPKLSRGMFFNSSFLFDKGINISPTACINATSMFSECKNMVLNRTWSSNSRIFMGDENLILDNTFKNCKNLFNGYSTMYEMPTMAKTVKYMFWDAHLYGLNLSSLASMNCSDLYGCFRNAIIDHVDGDIILNVTANNLSQLFNSATISSGWSRNITVEYPYKTADYSYAFFNMTPHPTNIYISNMYSSRGGWNPIVTVDDGVGLDFHVGPDSEEPYHIFRHIYCGTNISTDIIRADTGHGSVYRWNIEGVEETPMLGHWTIVSSSDNLQIVNAEQYVSFSLPYDRTNGYYYQLLDYQKYPGGTYPNGETVYYNLPSAMRTFSPEWFKNSTYNVIIRRG